MMHPPWQRAHDETGIRAPSAACQRGGLHARGRGAPTSVHCRC